MRSASTPGVGHGRASWPGPGRLSVLLAVLLLVWLPLRRRMSAQFAYGLFLLVLLKLAVPVSFAGLAWVPDRALGTIRTRVTSWLDQGSPPAPTAPLAVRARTPSSEFPTTGDFGAIVDESISARRCRSRPRTGLLKASRRSRPRPPRLDASRSRPP